MLHNQTLLKSVEFVTVLNLCILACFLVFEETIVNDPFLKFVKNERLHYFFEKLTVLVLDVRI